MERLNVLLFALLLIPSVFAETVAIDAAANNHPIDPRIYGVNNASQAQLTDINATINRSGGTPTSRYNWLQEAMNVGNDYFFESVPSGGATPGATGDAFIQASKAASAEPMLTVPMLDWVAKLGAGGTTLGSFSVAKYGPQDGSDGDFGTGVKPDHVTFIAGNDPNDANVPSSVAFQNGWVNHIVQQFGKSDANGLRYYLLDQEPGIWHASHRDVHPTGAMMQEIRDKMMAYAAMIKTNDSKAIVCGPDEWNFEGYLSSGYDSQYGDQHGDFDLHPDRDAHGGMDYLPYILDQFHQNEMAGNARLLDILSVHYYPQDRFNDNQGIFSDNVTAAVQLARNISTRSLWDPNYLDDSYLGDNGFKINLIPRVKGWINQYYPNTQLALNEYSWGAEGHIGGATAQADVLGIFGREGIDMACRWEAPALGTPVANAFKLYRNYDGNKSTFGDTSVAAVAANPDNLAAFAALRNSGGAGDGALTVIVINKVANGTPLQLTLANFNPAGTAQAWQLTAANSITRLADVNVADGNFNANLPAQSITLFIIPAGTPNHAPSIQSAAQATPNPAQTGQPVNFFVAATDADGDALTYQWTFGDSTQAAGASVQHVFATAGTYNANVSVKDTHGATVNSAVPVVVNVSTGGGGIMVFLNGDDSDNDGVLDALEQAADTDPNTAASTPELAALNVFGFKGAVFIAAQNRDTLTLSGTLSNLAEGFTPAGKTLTFFIGNLKLEFPLNAKGQSKTANGTLALKLKIKRDAQTGQKVFVGGDAPFSAKLRALDLTTTLGLSADTPSEALIIRVFAVLPNTVYSADVSTTYFPGGRKPGKLVK